MREELGYEEERNWLCGSLELSRCGSCGSLWHGKVSHQMGTIVKQNQGIDPLPRRRKAYEAALITFYSVLLESAVG